MKEFKLIVAGGREFNDYALLSHELLHLCVGPLAPYKDHEVSIVSGMARGADALAVQFARTNSVKLYEFPADWNGMGKVAGFKRNQHMADFADGLLAFWDGASKGTAHMIGCMRLANKPVHVVRYSTFEPASADVGDGENM
jgi:YspA, cpYpsA-related SLOG family